MLSMEEYDSISAPVRTLVATVKRTATAVT